MTENERDLYWTENDTVREAGGDTPNPREPYRTNPKLLKRLIERRGEEFQRPQASQTNESAEA